MLESNSLPFSGNEERDRSPYTRAQALADGALVDVSPISAEAGFKVPVAVTATVWTLLEPGERDERGGETIERRIRRMLETLRESADEQAPLVSFDTTLIETGRKATWHLQAVISADDEGKPVVTIMFPHEA